MTIKIETIDFMNMTVFLEQDGYFKFSWQTTENRI